MPEKTRTEKAVKELQEINWTGNIRELQNVVERSVILRKTNLIDAGDIQLPDSRPTVSNDITHIPPDGISLEEVEKGLIVKALQMSKGNRSQAARLLNIPRHVLIYRIEKFDLTD